MIEVPDGWFMPTLRDGRAAGRRIHLFREGRARCGEWRWQRGFKTEADYPDGAWPRCKGCSERAA